MKTRGKGTRAEYKTIALMREQGFVCTRSAGSGGRWDVVAVSAAEVVIIQVKCNRAPTKEEREQLESFAAPTNVRREIHIWHDNVEKPEVRRFFLNEGKPAWFLLKG